MAKLTTEKFIEKAKTVHGDKYDYSKVSYVSAKEKVCVICPEHGEFWQTPTVHLQGHGCRKCANIVSCDYRRKSLNDFVSQANMVHNNKYDYSKVEYHNTHSKVCIICPIHGEFWQEAKSHLSGCGCPHCSVDLRSDSVTDFISKAKRVHFDKYDYSLVAYKGSRVKVKIVCPKHGVFLQSPYCHLNGNGCPFCTQEQQRSGVYGTGRFDSSLTGQKSQCEKIWRGMMDRGYSVIVKSRGKSYIETSVSEQWHSFECFKSWFDRHYIEGWDLDKDILVKGNKIYSPETCCFVPPEINRSITSSKTTRGQYPIGVSLDKRTGRFIAKIQIGKKQHYLGCFDTINEAFNAYKAEREKHIRNLADKWKDQIEPRVYDALYNYKVEITD